jgi:hypothetical protein
MCRPRGRDLLYSPYSGPALKGREMRRAAGVALLVGCWCAIGASAGAATTIEVGTTADDFATATAAHCGGASAASCSLRDATVYANTHPGTTIDVPVGVYQLTGHELQITASVTITGHGDRSSGTEIVQQAASGARVLEITTTASSVSISNVEIAGGNLTSSDPTTSVYGGGILISSPSAGDLVTLTDVLIDHNSATGAPGTPGVDGGTSGGGGIRFNSGSGSGNLSLTRVTVSDNTAQGGNAVTNPSSNGNAGGSAYGGGIYFDGAQLTGADLTVTANRAIGATGGTGTGPAATGGYGGEGAGGGIKADLKLVSLTGGSIAGNVAAGGAGGNASSSGQTPGPGAGGDGGGLASGATTALNDVTVTGNQATSALMGTGGQGGFTYASDGGGLYLSSSKALIEQSTIDHNTADGGAQAAGYGGGVDVETGAVPIVNSTVTVNTARGDTSSGGGLHEQTGAAVTLAADTVDANQAAGAGSNIETAGPVVIGTTIIADPGGAAHANCATSGGSFAHLGVSSGNLEDDAAASCGFAQASGDQVGVSPKLGALAHNQGITDTMLPAPGSRVLGNAGNCLDPTAMPLARLAVDERNFPRPAASACDIGAVQIQPPTNSSPPTVVPAAPVQGDPLSCQSGGWSGDGSFSYAYTWLRDGHAIAGHASSGYITGPADVNHLLACTVTVTTSYGHTAGPVTSSAVKVARAPTPTFSGLHLTHRVFRTHGHRRKHKPPVGTAFVFKLNVPATLRLTFRHNKRTVGTFKSSAHQGTNTIKFTGKLPHGHKLKPGRYTVILIATSQRGIVSKPSTLSFLIKPS